MLCIIPLTSRQIFGALYPRVEPGQSGIRESSSALIDQLRSVDKRRVIAIAGSLTTLEMEAVDQGLRLYLGL